MRQNIKLIRNTVIKNGFCVVRLKPLDAQEMLVDIAHSLGTPCRALRASGIVDSLIAKNIEAAYQSSLSSRFGLGEFPFHTDDAVSDIPSRFVLLLAKKGGHLADTTLLDGRRIISYLPVDLRADINEAVFYIRNGTSSFTSTIVDQARQFIRFDPNVMRPTGRRSEHLFSSISFLIKTAQPTHIRWDDTVLLIVDNHRVLHGRCALPQSAMTGDRVLLRISVKE
jgi:L-asparagine oxygenase